MMKKEVPTPDCGMSLTYRTCIRQGASDVSPALGDEGGHQEAVLDRLEGIYGDTDKEAGFVDRIGRLLPGLHRTVTGSLLQIWNI